MANRRMFSKEICSTDSFNDLPHSSQALYFQLGLQADDDGFVSSPKTIMRSIRANEDDLRLLIAKAYIKPFDSGIIVITHWKQHNSIKKDRYNETIHLLEKSLITEENKIYKFKDTPLLVP